MSQPIDPYEQFEADVAPSTIDTPTQPLFHYTDAPGFLGILKAGNVWATHCQYLNDRREMEAGAELVHEVARALRDDPATHPDSRRLFEEFCRHQEQRPIHKWYRPFIASFSEAGNLLSQWRAYADDGAGYSLGLELPPVLDFEPRLNCRLMRCEYDATVFRNRVRAVFTDVANKRNAGLAAGLERKRLRLLAFHALIIHTATLVPRFKSTAFSEEREWRVVVFANSDENEAQLVRFRTPRRGLIPYFEIPCAEPDKPIPLVKVYVGPTQDVDTGIDAAALLLKQRGYSPAIVEGSGIPFRSSR